MNHRRNLLAATWARFLKDEEGQSTTEYILILAVVVMIAMKFKSVFGTKLDGIITKVGTQIDSATSSDQ